MVKNDFIFDEDNWEACIKLVMELEDIMRLRNAWHSVYANAEDFVHVMGKWPMNTSLDKYQAECGFKKMFDNKIVEYINSQGKGEES